MGLKSNLKVFCFFHVVEGLISLAIAFFHIFTFTDPNEPTTLQPLYLIVFFGFVLVSAFGVFKIARKELKFNVDAFLSLCGFMSFLFVSIASMADAENDPHLIYLTDDEEADHLYFGYNRYQSVASLANSLMFLLHCTFAVDLMLTQPKDDLSVASDSSEEEIHSEKPLKLYFFLDEVALEVKKKLNF